MLAGILDKKNYFTEATISSLGCDVRHLLSSARKIFRAWVYSASKMDPPASGQLALAPGQLMSCSQCDTRACWSWWACQLQAGTRSSLN